MNKEEKTMLVDFLMTATPKKLSTYIELLEEKLSKKCEFKTSIKSLFVSRTFSLLKVKRYVINNRRQKIVLDVHEGSIYLYANTKASENKDSLFEKVYDLYKDKLLEMVEQLEIKPLELEVV